MLAELLYSTAPALDAAAIASRASEFGAAVTASVQAGDKPPILLAHPSLEWHYADGTAPLQTTILQHELDGQSAQIAAALEQTWDWPEAGAAVARCRYSVLVSELMASPFPAMVRVQAFHRVVHAMAELHTPEAIHWVTSQRVVDPRTYLSAKQTEPADEIFPVVNVRMFRVEDSDQIVMDTRGLEDLGLPDLQCRFRNLEPRAVAEVLINTGCYVIETAAVLETGHTVAGIRRTDKWRCRLGMALVAPEREVIDLDSGTVKRR